MAKEFVKVPRKNIERKSGLYKIVHRDSGDTYIGMSSTDMKLQLSSILSPSSIARKKDTYRLEEAIDKYKEDAFDFYVCYINDTKENLQTMLNILRDSEKPELCAYTHPKVPEPPVRPELTVNQDQSENLMSCIEGVQKYLTNNQPDNTDVYMLVIFMIMHPELDVTGQVRNIGNTFVRESDGMLKHLNAGVVFLATNKMMQWNNDKTFTGMGNIEFLSYVANLMNNRDLIEYGNDENLRQKFNDLCSFLITKGKENYLTGYDFTFDSDCTDGFYEKYNWKIQERFDKDEKKHGYIIFDKAAGAGSKLRVDEIGIINPVIR